MPAEETKRQRAKVSSGGAARRGRREWMSDETVFTSWSDEDELWKGAPESWAALESILGTRVRALPPLSGSSELRCKLDQLGGLT